MNQDSILPDKENLRRAVKWLSEHRPVTMMTIDEASLRFDLSPADAAFLLRNFIHNAPPQS